MSQRAPLATSAARDQRLDIQVLRAFAVMSVVVFHLFPGRLTGGYVGVDVFFVISGYLIISHLLRELEDTGRIRLGAFWARRAKRLLPASLLTLLVTAIVVITLVPTHLQSGWLHEVVAASLYVENWKLASSSVAYLGATSAASPVQHFWSLSAEEQFYVATPILLLLAAWLAGRRRARHRVVVGMLVVLTVGSFVYSIVYTSSNPDVAYFATTTRAWEFLFGGLVAMLRWTPSPRMSWILGVTGLGAMAVACLLLDGKTQFPGWVAVVPVAGAALAILASDQGPWHLAARIRPLVWLGDQSYAIYLWHWPLIALVPVITGHRLTLGQKAAILVATMVVAWISTQFIESPIRFSPKLLGHGRRPLVVGAVCGLAMAVVAGVAATGAGAAAHHVRHAKAAAQQAQKQHLSCLMSAVFSDDGSKCSLTDGQLFPTLAAAATRVFDTECFNLKQHHMQMCHFGPATGAKLRVLAVGDSHSAMYLPAYQHWALTRGWQVDVTGAGNCWWAAGKTASATPSWGNRCNTLREDLSAYLASHPPYDVIITAGYNLYDNRAALEVTDPGQSQDDAKLEHLTQAWTDQIARGSVVVPILDSPHQREDDMECIAANGTGAETACTVPSSGSLPKPDFFATVASQVPGAVAVDAARDLICRKGTCKPVVGNVIAYSDPNHLSPAFVETIADSLGDAVEAARIQALGELGR